MHSLSMFKIYVSISQIKISLGGEKRNGAKIIVLMADKNLIYYSALSLQKTLLDALFDSRYKYIKKKQKMKDTNERC